MNTQFSVRLSARSFHALALMLVFACVAALSIAVARPASAETIPESGSAILSNSQIGSMRAHLTSSELPRVNAVAGGEQLETFILPSGSTIGVPVATSRLSSGVSGSTIFIKLNKTDQQALLNGGAVALGAALCNIPAIGWVACAAIGSALAIGMTYVRAHGICKGSKPNLRVLLNGEFTSSCVA